MRVLMTTDTVGGVWTFTKELATELLHRNHEVALVSFGRAPSPDQQAVVDALALQFPDRFAYHASEAPLEWMPENASASSASEPLMLALCESFVPHILLSSQFCYGALDVDVPKIVIAHSDVLSWAEAVGKAPLTESDWLHTYRLLVQNGLSEADLVVTPTHAMLRDLKANFDVPSPAAVIANGRTLPSAEPKARRVQAVTAGRMWDEAKNLRLIAQIESPMPIVIAGETGGTNYVLPRASNAQLVGAKSENALFDLFRSSAVYLCTSLYEPFGLAPLEAALCGCAVVANDIPSLREVWGKSALYFRDAEELKALLHKLCHEPQMLADAQERSHRCATAHTTERMTDSYLNLMHKLLTNEPGGQAHAA